VKDSKFWVLETAIEKKKEITIFGEEKDAINTVVENLQLEKEISEETAGKYNLQQITITPKAFEVVPVSWFKVLAGYASAKSKSA
jgi:hypothetical protein